MPPNPNPDDGLKCSPRSGESGLRQRPSLSWPWRCHWRSGNLANGVQVLEGDRAAAPEVLPEVTIVRNDPQDVAPKSEVAVTTPKQSERKSAATAAPVLTPEQFAALAQDGPPVANSAAVTPPPVTTAVLAGTVQDSSSAFIPGVTITATNTNTGTVVNAITNESGAYRLPSVQPGTYQVSAVLPGFQTQTVTNLPVGPVMKRA